MLAEIAINVAPIANTEYSPFYLNFGYHPVFWWDLPDRQESGVELGRRRCGVWYIG